MPTVTEAVAAPVLHWYALPPEAVSTAALPPQSPAGPPIAAFGAAFSVNVLLFVPVQPAAFVAVTVYVPADATLATAVVAPVLHRYDDPPEAVSGVGVPAQRLDAPEMFATGFVPLETVTVAVAVQPPPSVAVTV